MVHDVYIERDDEKFGPPEKLIRINHNDAARMFGNGKPMDAVIHFALGKYDENFNESHFVSAEEGRFSIKTIDLFNALIALGILSLESRLEQSQTNPDWKQPDAA